MVAAVLPEAQLTELYKALKDMKDKGKTEDERYKALLSIFKEQVQALQADTPPRKT